MEISSDLLRGHLDSLVLSALERDCAHGLEIIRRIEAAGFGLLHLKEGSLYPALYRLENSGWVTSRVEAVPAGQKGAPRRIYRLTSRGRRRLSACRSEWRQFVQVIGGILGAPA